ncbi:DUF4102 domain-containing protein [Pseudoalteromonas sp. CO325X]|uniref:integrase domain-containing protein n=1 Tax=Pseudoalteromonas sp. CO325X TaxID=1777262 RepID=UPI001022A692|nr:integrase domain-containing protein [Pseudoalteromonas sp. CO325X]RZF80528.1 DUF4102 domain-containing protein [Pseudoalteromonas sp. CO325X]
MAKTVKPLNDTQLKNIKPTDKVQSLADGYGLYFSVAPNSTKSWQFKYQKPYTKKRTNISFGKYPEVTLAQARKKRDEARALLAENIDPKEQRERHYEQETRRRENTLIKVAELWFDVHKSKVTPGYAKNVWSSLQLHIFPTLGEHPIDAIDAQQAIKVIKPIEAKGNLETVKRLCQRLNDIMTFAVNTGYIKHNPLAGIRAAFTSPKKESMKTIKEDELPEFMSALQNASIKNTTRCLIAWQLHTMTRPNEAAKTTWEEIDFEKQIWTIPAERMKTRKEHRIPLSPQAVRILEKMRTISGNREHVFPADRNPRTHANLQTANAAIKRMGFHGRLVAHGLRALASTILNDHQQFDYLLIEAALAHQDKNEVRAAYNRADYLEKRREMMCWWSDFITRAQIKSLEVI